MNSARIEYVFENDCFGRAMWKGFLAPDIILKGHPTPPFPQFYILNTAPSFSSGEHWCVVFVFEDFCEFFDSYGNPPEFFGLDKTIMQHCNKVISNSRRIQSFFSLVCGHHCLYYALMRVRGFSLSEILSTYSNDCHLNDDLVFDWVSRNFGKEVAEI
jgi:hypothetical protein